MNRRIVFLDRATLPADRIFDFSFPHVLTEHAQTSPTDTAARMAGAHIAATNKVRITAEHIAANPQLEMIAVCATGCDHIDTAAARAAGIAVCNIPAYGSEAVAEHAFMLMMALMRNLPAYQRDLRAGLWQNSPFFCHFGAPIRDLNGKTLAIFGRGNIGDTLARYARAFGMNVVFAERKNAAATRAGYVSFDHALRQADVLSLHCPLTEATRHLIGEDELRAMKPGAVLINCGRGGLIDETALLAALKYGTLGGAGLDVLAEEPPQHGNPLLKANLPHLILTPHIAWASDTARHKMCEILCANIEAFAAGRPQNRVA
ncbi:Glycerate dehydrogenase [Kingella potus]|uniref:Glycerate dehydrogenase n=1 Tax=Kingella potus TaxID=265175 RepID=A0A377R019_9NEIS|nr:D-2-hydroxyacid dehydrogenase [Kingella potus]UOP00929.1 D-2-hydroxyacid dehydrogenase [Kingella potus]STR00592.1 Glycerate dehydrogenase [Kingella potus]